MADRAPHPTLTGGPSPQQALSGFPSRLIATLFRAWHPSRHPVPLSLTKPLGQASKHTFHSQATWV